MNNKANPDTKDKSKYNNKIKILNLQGDYNFTDIKDMSKAPHISKILTLRDDNWARTGEFSIDTNNHCAAVASTNIALYFASQGYVNLLTGVSKTKTFYKIHGAIGNGPVVRIAKNTSDYFKSRGYNLQYGKVHSYKGIKESIDRNRPCAVLISVGINKWHWVIAVGYREYQTGEKHIQIINGWENTSGQFFQIKNGPKIISATEYWIKLR